MMHQRQFLQREGRGRVPEAAPRPGARQVLPGGGFSFLLPSSCFFKALQSVPFATDSMGNSSFFSRLLPGAWLAARPGLQTRAAGGTGRRAPGAAATWPPEPAPCRWSLVGRLGRAGQSARSPHARTAAARRGSRRPGEGVLFGIQRTRTAAAAAAAAREVPAATSPPCSHPWVKGIFPRRGGRRPRRRRRDWCGG